MMCNAQLPLQQWGKESSVVPSSIGGLHSFLCRTRSIQFYVPRFNLPKIGLASVLSLPPLSSISSLRYLLSFSLSSACVGGVNHRLVHQQLKLPSILTAKNPRTRSLRRKLPDLISSEKRRRCFFDLFAPLSSVLALVFSAPSRMVHLFFSSRVGL